MRLSSLLVLALLALAGLPAAAQQPVDISIVINGETLPNEPPPRLVGGKILIPLRPVFNALGADVKSENKVITAQRGDRVVELVPNEKEASINGELVELEVPPLLFDGSLYVPLRFVAQAMGDDVAYDGNTKTLTVTPSVAEEPIDVPPDRIAILETRLKQLVVGNQGAILKVRNPQGNKEVYYRGLDDRDTAPYDAQDQAGILEAVKLRQDLSRWTGDAIEAFILLPKRETIAFLGMVYSIPDDAANDPGPMVDKSLKEFLISVVSEHPDVVLRRQAVLSMAVGDGVDPQVLEAVLKLYETSENLWETFPVQQYFQYHADELRTLPIFPRVRSRVAAVNSLYTANILQYLDGN